LTDASVWRHVPSPDNPADLLSRGVDPRNIICENMWWHGPHFLAEPEVHWPNQKHKQSEDDLPEKRKTALTVTATEPNRLLESIDKYSNLNKICRITAYCLRLKRKARDRAADTRVSHEECTTA